MGEGSRRPSDFFLCDLRAELLIYCAKRKCVKLLKKDPKSTDARGDIGECHLQQHQVCVSYPSVQSIGITGRPA